MNNNDWSLTISKTDNGYYAIGFSGDESNESFVIEDKDDTTSVEQHTMCDLLNKVQQYFGIYYSKHNEKNCVVSIE